MDASTRILNDAIAAFEQQFVNVVRVIREQMNTAEVNTMFFNAKATGRVGGGDLKLTFTIACNEYGGDPVNGNAVLPIIHEVLRRRGFDLRNAPLALGYDGEVKSNA